MEKLRQEWEKIYIKKLNKGISLSWENEKDYNIEKFLKFLNFNKDFKLVEVGIWSGVNVSLYKKLGLEKIYWIEISKVAIKILKRIYPEVKIININMCDVNIRALWKYDIIIEWWVLHTLNPNCWNIYLENLRKLFSKKSIWYLRVFKTDENNYIKIWNIENTELNLRAMNKIYLKKLLNDHWFNIINLYSDEKYYDGIWIVWIWI